MSGSDAAVNPEQAIAVGLDAAIQAGAGRESSSPTSARLGAIAADATNFGGSPAKLQRQKREQHAVSDTADSHRVRYSDVYSIIAV